MPSMVVKSKFGKFIEKGKIKGGSYFKLMTP
jgi:hypothetical protein